MVLLMAEVDALRERMEKKDKEIMTVRQSSVQFFNNINQS